MKLHNEEFNDEKYFSQDTDMSFTVIDVDCNEKLIAKYKKKFVLDDQVDLYAERTCWTVYGQYGLNELEEVVNALASNSKLILVSDVNDFYDDGLTEEEEKKLANWIGCGDVEVVYGDSPVNCAKNTVSKLDRLFFDGWRPLISVDLESELLQKTKNYYQTLGETLNTTRVMDATRDKNLVTYIQNSLINLPVTLMSHDLDVVIDAFDGRPVLLVSAGPSLLKQLPILEKYQSLFTIIVASAAYQNLKKHNISPDYILVVDPNKKIVWDERCNIGLIKDIGCDPMTAWSNTKLSFMTTHHPSIKELMYAIGYDVSSLYTGGCVATSAFNVARMMGSNPIFMIGQDLAYTDGKARVDGYTYEAKIRPSQKLSPRRFSVPGFGGAGEVETDPALLLYKTWFESQISQMDETIVFNCTEGGADIKGSVPASFEEVCKELTKSKITKQTQLYEANDDSQYMELLSNGVKNLIADVSSYRDSLTSALRILSKRISPKGINLKKLDAANAEIREVANHVKFLCDSYSANEIKDIQIEISRDEERDQLKAFAYYESIYIEAKDGAMKALTFLRELNVFYAILEKQNWESSSEVKDFIAENSLNKY